MARSKENIVVVNMLDEIVYRAGFVFRPKAERKVSVTKNGYAELEACGALVIYTNGLKCDCPGCDFTAKSERGLQNHKRKHRKDGG